MELMTRFQDNQDAGKGREIVGKLCPLCPCQLYIHVSMVVVSYYDPKVVLTLQGHDCPSQIPFPSKKPRTSGVLPISKLVLPHAFYVRIKVSSILLAHG